MTSVIALARADRAGTTIDFAGVQSYLGTIGGFEVAAVFNGESVKSKGLMDTLLLRLKAEVLVLARRPGGLLQRLPIGRVDPMDFGHESMDRSTNFMYWGNASHPAQAITTSRQRGSLLGQFSGALIINFAALATDAALCAAVINVVDTLVASSEIKP